MAQEFDLGSVRGGVGPRGPEGPQGPQGPRGIAGVTPNVQIGSVTTAETGMPGSVQRRADSPDEVPVLDFVLPGPAGDMAKSVYDPRNMHQDIFTYVDRFSGRNPATVVVAAFNSISKEKADLICSGVSDQLTIQEAIDRLPAEGGSVLLLEGTYLLDNYTISPVDGAYVLLRADQNNVVIRGQGDSTKLVVKDQGITANARTVVLALGGKRSAAEDLAIHGNSENNAGAVTEGIRFGTEAEGSRITHVMLEGLTDGMVCKSGKCDVKESVIQNCTNGVSMEKGDCCISGCQIAGCSQKGLSCADGSFFVVNNRITECGVYGIWLDKGNQCNFTGNVLIDNPTGIWLQNSEFIMVHENMIWRNTVNNAYGENEYPIFIHDSVWMCVNFNISVGKDVDGDSNANIHYYYDGYNWNLS